MSLSQKLKKHVDEGQCKPRAPGRGYRAQPHPSKKSQLYAASKLAFISGAPAGCQCTVREPTESATCASKADRPLRYERMKETNFGGVEERLSWY
uniref:Uncharacterized protein n=1 Tax=Gossypium raimondii TaxID=29730 RepID=A0A0D2RMG3_GOSRA|nr:hypothetical protein B456_011G145200 [Gossypium raimondii]